MKNRYICLVFLVVSLQLWPTVVTEHHSNNPSTKEKLKNIPDIPELSTNIKDPSRWKNGTRLIFFYSPWCEHSLALKPLLQDVIAEVYYRNISGIWVGQIDVSVKSDIARTFRIKNTPTLILFRNGTRYEFDDDPTVEKIVEFISKVMSPSVSEIYSQLQLKELLVHHPVLFLLVYDEEIDPDWKIVYSKVARERVLIGKFFYTVNSSIPQQIGFSLPSLPRLLVLKDDQAYHYTETLTKYKMTLWVESEQFPALPFTNRTTFRPIVTIGNTKRLAILFVSTIVNIPLNEKKAVEAVRRVAEGRKLNSGYQFAVLDDTELVYKMTGSYLSVPTFFVWDKKSGFYYLYDPSSQGGFSEKPITKFLFSITSGKIKESGGLSLLKISTHYYWMTYNLFQAMISHRPFLSLFSIVCLILGLSFCFYTRVLSNKKQEFNRKLRVRRAIRRRERNTAQQHREGEEDERSSVRRRRRQPNEDNDEEQEQEDAAGRVVEGSEEQDDEEGEVENNNEELSSEEPETDKNK